MENQTSQVPYNRPVQAEPVQTSIPESGHSKPAEYYAQRVYDLEVELLRLRAMQAEPVAWRYRNSLGEIVSEWIDGPPPEYVRDANTNERVEVKDLRIDVAYASPPTPVSAGLDDMGKQNGSEKL